MKFIPIVLIIILSTLTGQGHNKEKHIKLHNDSVKTQITDHHVNGMENNHMNLAKKEKVSLDAFPTLHPMVVHFPIVLLLLALFTQFVALFVFRKELNWITLFLIFGGLIGAYIAGQLVHPHTTGLTETASWVLEKHEKFADYTLWTALVAFILKIVSQFLLKNKIWMEIIILAVLAFSAYSVSETSHYGAQLLHIEGVGAQGNYIELPDAEINNSHSH